MWHFHVCSSLIHAIQEWRLHLGATDWSANFEEPCEETDKWGFHDYEMRRWWLGQESRNRGRNAVMFTSAIQSAEFD